MFLNFLIYYINECLIKSVELDNNYIAILIKIIIIILIILIYIAEQQIIILMIDSLIIN